jgi:hypothetical protein
MRSFDIACVYDLLLCALLQSHWPNNAGHERESSWHSMKLTFSGTNQLIHPQTWAFTLVVISCVITQMNYLNKVF